MFYRKYADNSQTNRYVMRLAIEGTNKLKPKWTHLALARYLNRKGYKTASGNRWTRASLTYFLNRKQIYRNGRLPNVVSPRPTV